ncbi:hypothetical protein L1987_65296 [Smallanthus sonchifolius]|uniref:Uncharacterized protein n=1 Tax=Smallanthus sonchifolius TaxID=185202 RepID=A0ACB9BTX2_9ASTR|nr:hypothetical protein L1987_65296 [Smallanthus sonchifolius]
MGYEMAPPPPFVYVPTLPPESYRGAPIFPLVSPPSIIVPGTEPPMLSVSILRQIEFYFSDANLVKDNYLRSHMDAEGWVLVTLIAGFPRVQSLTSDMQMILSSLRESTVVEVQGETVRRRNDWRKWVKPSVNFPQDSSSRSPQASADASTIETSLQKLTLDELTITERNNTRNKEEASNINSVGWVDSSNPANSNVTPGDEYLNPKSSTSSYQDL